MKNRECKYYIECKAIRCKPDCSLILYWEKLDKAIERGRLEHRVYQLHCIPLLIVNDRT